MMAPWFPDLAAVAALPVGIGFGVALERAGLGSARTIADQLRGRDFTVIKVMFAAIITAMLGVFWATRLGWLDLSLVAMPETDLIPQAIGAVLFGAGFAIASLCPGTACVAAGAGHRDGLITIGGLFLGTLVVMLAWPDLGAAAENTPRTSATLPGDLGWPAGVVVGAIAIGGVLVLGLAGRFEGRVVSWAPSRLAVVALALGALAIATRDGAQPSGGSLTSIAADIAAERDHVDPLDLAEWIKAARSGLRVIDVRERGADSGYQIPGSESVPLEQVPGLSVAPGDTIVLYSDGGTHAAQAWVLLRTRGITGVYVLRDGLAAWEDEVRFPHPVIGADSAAMAAYRRAAELSRWFGGFPSRTPRAPNETRPGAVRSRRNSC